MTSSIPVALILASMIAGTLGILLYNIRHTVLSYHAIQSCNNIIGCLSQVCSADRPGRSYLKKQVFVCLHRVRAPTESGGWRHRSLLGEHSSCDCVSAVSGKQCASVRENNIASQSKWTHTPIATSIRDSKQIPASLQLELTQIWWLRG